MVAPVNHHKVYDGCVGPVLEPALDVHWLLSVTRKATSKFKCEYPRYRGNTDDDAGQLTVVLVHVSNDLDDIFAQETL